MGFPAKDTVDPGFLELVRYGIRKAGDPLIEDSLRVIDAFLKVMAPAPRATAPADARNGGKLTNS